jgi:hypothetical protein
VEQRLTAFHATRRRRVIDVLSLWVVALLGGPVGASLAFMLDRLRVNAEAGGFYDEPGRDAWLWMLMSVLALGIVAVSVAVVPIDARRGAVAALVGAFVVAVAPVDFRSPPVPGGVGLASLLVSPAVLIIVVVATSVVRSGES